MNNPWETYPDIWKTQASFMSWVRGGLRRALWNKSPIKINFIKKHRIKIPNPKKTNRSPNMIFGGICEACSHVFQQKDLQVDHKIGNHSLKEIKDIQTFIENIVMVDENDLQFICKECHAIKSHAERMGISIEEAKKEKQIINYMKMSVEEQIKILSEHHLPHKNAKERKESWRKIT